jgi:glycerophosphoryl diester phosphodiesterase
VSPRPYYAFQVPERAGRLHVMSRAFLQQAHRDRARVDVWVIDAADDIQRLFTLGADGVITDRPDVAVKIRDAWMTRIHPDGAE